jgi:hypothetical protein
MSTTRLIIHAAMLGAILLGILLGIACYRVLGGA